MTNTPRGEGADRAFFSNYLFSVVAFPCTLLCFLKLWCACSFSGALFRTLPHTLFNICMLSPSLAISCILVPSFFSFSLSGHPACAQSLCCFGALER